MLQARVLCSLKVSCQTLISKPLTTWNLLYFTFPASFCFFFFFQQFSLTTQSQKPHIQRFYGSVFQSYQPYSCHHSTGIWIKKILLSLILYCTSYFQVALFLGSSKISHIKNSMNLYLSIHKYLHTLL